VHLKTLVGRPTTSIRVGDHEQIRHSNVSNVIDAHGEGHVQYEGFSEGLPNRSLLLSFIYHVPLKCGRVRLESKTLIKCYIGHDDIVFSYKHSCFC